MQAAGMLRGTRAISLLVLLVALIGYAYSSPLQYLPNIPGYIPVYIRYGDEPLEKINPELAEAFGETSNSVKSLQKIDHTLAHETDNFKDDDIDVFLEESNSKHAYPLHVRATESRSFATVNNNNDPNKPKLLTIYELPDDNETRPRRRYRERNRMNSWKPPASKMSPLSDEEREKLEKLAIEVEREETKPNELYVPISKYADVQGADRAHSRHRTPGFVAPLKVQNPFDGSSADLPDIPQITDPRITDPESSDDVAASEDGKEELPIKGQRPVSLLANVDKVSPIDSQGDGKIDEATRYEAGEEKQLNNEADLPKISQETQPMKELNSSEISDDTDDTRKFNDCDVASSKSNKNELAFKVQRPDSILSNVDKLSPINLPDESERVQNKAKDSTESNDEMIAKS